MKNTAAIVHVLLIDAYDECDMYADMLRFHGLVVTCARTATEGLNVLDQQHTDVIVQGLSFPDLSGYELAKCVKAREGTRNTPLIALSGFTDQAHLEQARAAGCDSVLMKPCRPETLLVEVRQLFAASRGRRARGNARNDALPAKAGWLEPKIGGRSVKVPGTEGRRLRKK